ncbi:hypothetical protein [Rhizobium leguminosarum]|uniref:hypothetical protein n=1 Tax=Rhizobium leguminosarum TaxID=384 RepID=UPI00039B6204|nr:hypothetical protein [Rhizobium leguminosarum]
MDASSRLEDPDFHPNINRWMSRPAGHSITAPPATLPEGLKRGMGIRVVNSIR